MALTRATLLTAAEALVQDEAQKISHADPGDFGTAIDLAVERYSKDRPREAVATASGDGSAFDFALPSGWIEGFSTLLRVETPYPRPSGQRYPNVVFDATAPNAPAEVIVVQATSSAKKLSFQSITPESGTNNILFVFTGKHTVHASAAASTTVPETDEGALTYLVASIACEMVAAKYAETKDASIGVDSVDFRSRSGEYAARSRALMKRYLAAIGADPDAELPPASSTADLDMTLYGGRDRLIRRSRYT